MSQEQEDIQRLIRGARRAAPDEQALARVWQRLQAPPPAGPDDGGAEVPDPAALANATQALAGKAAAATSLKAIAAVVVVGAALAGGRWLTRPGPSAPAEAAVEQREAPREPAPAVEVAIPEAPTTVEASAPTGPPPAKQAGRRSAGGAASGGTANSSEAETSGETGPDLAAERRLLEAAQAALQRGATAAALARLDEHGRRFAHGLLADEREVLRVLALCAEHRADEAEAVAQALLRGGPGLFLPRLRGSCVGERLVPVQRPKGKRE
ncbi:hypothetical protein SAMN02745121_07343 [Nannocystis exedens]|uniref:Uncharacterized protein n=1 Tax=Nannocystis exedens TaxID=54 RepID=A0A1I2GLY0_9BACT|nr:hypothetical protein [Nannocystis exedens]PCC73595.1 hypothetical protein NAEX_06683 [Nannocystis exedens]SFF17611.1 hypothetical protein SAMN02745121_07343 [Nannocystis exedens]